MRAKKSQKSLRIFASERTLDLVWGGAASHASLKRQREWGFMLVTLLVLATTTLSGCAGLVSGSSTTTPSATLTISNVQVASTTVSTAQIVWTTNAPADSSVDYGTTPSYGSTTPVDSTMVTSHQVTLSGLAAGTTYYYQVNSTDAKNNHGKSGGHNFATKGFNISGSITPTNGGSGATVTLNGASSATTTTNSSGAFTFSGLPSGSYVVTPSNAGYTFTPASQSVNVGTTNVTGVNFTATSTATAPTITTQPVNQTVTAGQTATFSVVASGTAPLSYQWQKNGANLAGATSASYTTPATTTADSGSTFDVVVSNSAGTVTSNAATLTVNPAAVAPTITTQPANQTVTAGQTATFTVVASGTTPLNYQWRMNGSPIAGAANSSTYTTPATTTAQSGEQFTVVVSNSAGSVTSNAAALTVNSPPPGALNPSTTSVNFGNVSVGGTSTLPVTFTNAGAANISIANVIISGAGITASGLSAGLTVTPGQTVTLNVTFTPAAVGSVTGNVTVTSNASNSPATISVTGTGVQSQAITITGGGLNAITVSVDSSGSYQITTSNPSWTFGGQVGFPLTSLAKNTGTDGVGGYQEIDFNYQASVSRTSGIRLYNSKPVILFTTTYNAAGANSQPFPVLSTYPNNPYHLSYDETTDFSPHVFNWSGLNGPLLSFDGQANAFLLSAGSDFLVTQTQQNSSGALVTGINTSDVSSLPQGFTHNTMLVVSPGISQTYQIWGQAMTDMNGKTRPANDADPILKYIGYITDHKMAYFYNFVSSLGYQGTLEAVKTDFANHGIPLGYVQLDSWFYPKGCSPPSWSCGTPMVYGVYTYNADPAIFPSDLSGFEQSIQIPLWAHARWIDKTSPYHSKYTMSGDAITDPLYWQDRANYLQQSGAKVFEQDWLQRSGDGSAPIVWNLTDPEAYLGNMASAMQSHGLNIQYSMPRAGHYLQSTKYNNVTTIRVSKDGFNQGYWDVELYNSQLANAVGLWPFTDGFMSSSVTDTLLTTLSAGVVAAGDAIGAENAANLAQAIRGDGVLIKPDAPMVPMDKIYIADAQGMTTSPMIAWTYTDHAPMKAAYVFAFTRGTNTSGPISLSPASLGITGAAYVYNFFSKTGTLVSAGGSFTDTVGLNGTYYVIAPVGASGIALLGDTIKFVSSGKQRISQLQDNGTVSVTVSFAANESSVTLSGYAPSTPTVTATSGSVGTVSYNSTTHIFSVPVMPGPAQSAAIQLH